MNKHNNFVGFISFESIQNDVDPIIAGALKNTASLVYNKSPSEVSNDEISRVMSAMDNTMFSIISGQVTIEDGVSIVSLWCSLGFPIEFIEHSMNVISGCMHNMQEN